MAREIIIKPLITEKTENISETAGKFTFVVDKKANKIEIRKAVEALYNVSVDSVNTLIMPSKSRVRNTRSGVQKGRKSSFKKAIVTLSPGENIDFFGDL